MSDEPNEVPDEDLLVTLVSDLKEEVYFLRADAERSTSYNEKYDLLEQAEEKLKAAKALHRFLEKNGVERLGSIKHWGL